MEKPLHRIKIPYLIDCVTIYLFVKGKYIYIYIVPRIRKKIHQIIRTGTRQQVDNLGLEGSRTVCFLEEKTG
jgi:hypothetical protein